MKVRNVIKDEVYKKFIDYAYTKDLVMRVTLSNFGLDEEELEVLNLTKKKLLALDPQNLIKIITHENSMILPSVEVQRLYYLNHPKVDVWQEHYYFHFSLKLKEYLLSIEECYKRKIPQFPEDICFMKNGYYWFESYSVDEESAIYCEDSKEYEYLKKIGIEFYDKCFIEPEKLKCNDLS